MGKKPGRIKFCVPIIPIIHPGFTLAIFTATGQSGPQVKGATFSFGFIPVPASGFLMSWTVWSREIVI
jgi:hypothetical protein